MAHPFLVRYTSVQASRVCSCCKGFAVIAQGILLRNCLQHHNAFMQKKTRDAHQESARETTCSVSETTCSVWETTCSPFVSKTKHWFVSWTCPWGYAPVAFGLCGRLLGLRSKARFFVLAAMRKCEKRTLHAHGQICVQQSFFASVLLVTWGVWWNCLPMTNWSRITYTHRKRRAFANGVWQKTTRARRCATTSSSPSENPHQQPQCFNLLEEWLLSNVNQRRDHQNCW